MISWQKFNTLWCPVDASVPATAWWDTTLPGALLRGTGAGVRIIRDWSGGHRHLFQATAANQGTMLATGPGGSVAILADNLNDGWEYSGGMGGGFDHTIVVGCKLNTVPAATPAWALVSGVSLAATYTTLGTDDHHVSIRDAAGWHNSNLVFHTGFHSYSAVCNGSDNTALLYEDTTAAAAAVTCAGKAFSGSFSFCVSSTDIAPDGSVFRLAYWNGRLSAVDLALAQAWAVRSP